MNLLPKKKKPEHSQISEGLGSNSHNESKDNSKILFIAMMPF